MGIVIPGHTGLDIETERRVGDTTCPAASDGNYADSGRRYVRCAIADDHFAVATNPRAAIGFCCGEYTACPVWLADRAGTTDVDLIAHYREIAQRQQDRITDRQIASGTRRDDRFEREVDQASRELEAEGLDESRDA